MAWQTWQQTFKRGGVTYKNASISIYLAGTTTPARIFDQGFNLHDTAPQVTTDATGYVEFSLDTDDYPTTGQLFDLTCVPRGACSTAQTISLTSLQLLQDSDGGRFFAVEDGADQTATHTAQDTQYVSGGTLAAYASTPNGEAMRIYGDLGVYDGGVLTIYDATDIAAIDVYGGASCRLLTTYGGDFDIITQDGSLGLAGENGIDLNSDVAIEGDIIPASDKTYEIGDSDHVLYGVNSQILFLVAADGGDWWGAEVTNNGVFRLGRAATKGGSYAFKLSLNTSGNLKTTGTMTPSTTLDS